MAGQAIIIAVTRERRRLRELNDAIYGRRSVREYTLQKVDEQAIRRLIEAAVHAPNAVNQQPWMFTVVRDKVVLDKLSRAAKSHMLATITPTGHSDHFRSLLSDSDFHIFYQAPVLVLISAAAQGPWIVEHCALAGENLMLAAHDVGLGTFGLALPKVSSIPLRERICSTFRQLRSP